MYVGRLLEKIIFNGQPFHFLPCSAVPVITTPFQRPCALSAATRHHIGKREDPGNDDALRARVERVTIGDPPW